MDLKFVMHMSDNLEKHMEAFKTEVCMLLRFHLAFDRLIKFEDFNQITRCEWADRIISLKALENDMILRICKFDDGAKGVHSFKKIEKLVLPNIKKQFIEKTNEFSQMIATIKKERRNEQLAHLKFGNIDDEYEPRYRLKPALELIIEIVDLINGSKILYNWKDGRYEKYELRNMVFGL